MTDTNQKLREALQVARDHIDMDALEISHCKDATLIRQALALPTEPAHADTWGISRAMVTLYAYECDGLTGEALALPTAAPVGELPELPEPTWSTGLGVAFTADQMRAYAREAMRKANL